MLTLPPGKPRKKLKTKSALEARGVYFLWERTPHGTIRVSGDGLADFIRRSCLSAKFRLYSLAMAAAENASSCEERLVTLVLSSSDRSREPGITRRIKSLLKPMGMIASVAWADRGSPGSLWIETRFTLLRNPWAWMALASSIALVAIAGWDGLFWTAFWGTAAWFAARGLAFLFQGRGRFPGPGVPPEMEGRR